MCITPGCALKKYMLNVTIEGSSSMSRESFNEESELNSTEIQESGVRELIRDPFEDVSEEAVQAELDGNPELAASLIKFEQE